MSGREAWAEKDNLIGYHCFLALQGIDSFCVTTINYIISFHFKKFLLLDIYGINASIAQNFMLHAHPHPLYASISTGIYTIINDTDTLLLAESQTEGLGAKQIPVATHGASDFPHPLIL